MPHRKKKQPTILMPTMGDGDMPDTKALVDALEKEGWRVICADLSCYMPDSIFNLPWNQIDIVDTRNMRGSLTNFAKYIEILDEVDAQIERQRSSGRVVSKTLQNNTIDWLADKSKYLKLLEHEGVHIIPTQVISYDRNGLRDNPVERRTAAENIYSNVMSGETDRFVIKPSTSALAKGLRFIEVDRNANSITVIEPQQTRDQNSEHEVSETYDSRTEFVEAMAEYMRAEKTHDGQFLLQEYIDNLETSAVFINGTPHYVVRHTGPSHIAHGNFGGVDSVTAKKDIDPNVIKFVDFIRGRLPEFVRNSSFYRIDVMQQTGNGLILGEIEGAGGARLWLEEARGALKSYVSLLDDMFKNNQSAQKQLGKTFKTSAGNDNSPHSPLMAPEPTVAELTPTVG